MKLRNLLMSGMALLTCAMMSTGCSLSSSDSAAADEPAEFVAEPNQIVQHADQYKGKKINTVIQVKLVQNDKIIGTESIAMGPNFTIEYKAQGNEKEIQKGDYLRVIGTVDEINEKLRAHGILGGFNLKKANEELGDAMLIAVTENRSLEEIDRFVKIMEEI